MLHRTITILRGEGLLGFGSRAAAYLYRRAVRPWLPAVGAVRYAGLPVAYVRKWGDGAVPVRWLPAEAADEPGYEATLIAALEEQLRPGDRVVIVGGGVGVTATVAAQRVGPRGSVLCFEGAREGVEKTRRTAALNGVAERVAVRHAIVARAISVYGAEPESAPVHPAALPECDVLELDCEGAELDILREMVIRPRVVLVETHGCYGAPTGLVAALLGELGYRVTERGIAEPRFQAYCEEADIRIVLGVREVEMRFE